MGNYCTYTRDSTVRKGKFADIRTADVSTICDFMKLKFGATMKDVNTNMRSVNAQKKILNIVSCFMFSSECEVFIVTATYITNQRHWAININYTECPDAYFQSLHSISSLSITRINDKLVDRLLPEELWELLGTTPFSDDRCSLGNRDLQVYIGGYMHKLTLITQTTNVTNEYMIFLTSPTLFAKSANLTIEVEPSSDSRLGGSSFRDFKQRCLCDRIGY
jgi:hypothetical protein